MKKLKYLICIVGLIILLSGCGGLNPIITTPHKAVNYNRKIHSLSIIYLASKLGTDETQIHQDDFVKLKTAFIQANIKTNLLLYSDLDLNSAQGLNILFKKNPYLMIINPVRMTTGDVCNITYNVCVYDVGLKQKIWAADLLVPCGWSKSVYQRFDEMGQLLVSKLYTSNLVSNQ